MDLSSVPSWTWWVVAGLLVTLVVVAAYFGILFAYRRLSRRYLVQVVGRREGVLASRRTLEAVVRHLADEDDEKLEHFASHPEDEDRKALDEVARRMEIATEELDTMPLPRSLWPAAMALADAAYIIGQEAGRVGGRRTRKWHSPRWQRWTSPAPRSRSMRQMPWSRRSPSVSISMRLPSTVEVCIYE
jgi:hypothetical protein